MDVDEQQIDNAANNGTGSNDGGVGSDVESHPNENNNNNSNNFKIEEDVVGNGDNNDNGDDSDNHSVESIASIDSNGVRVKFCNPWEFDEEVVDRLHNNDPSCDSIWIWSSHMNPLDIDWGKEGSALSENTRLKSLDIEQFESEIKSDRERRYAERNARNFYRSIAGCKSIKYLTMKGCFVPGLLDMKEIITILTPSLRNSLCSLIVSDIALDSDIIDLFVTAVSESNPHLRCIGLNHCGGMNSGVMTKIVKVLAAAKITELHLDEYDLDKEVGVILGDALYTNLSLKKLYMSGVNEPPTLIGSIGEGGMKSIARCLSRSDSLVEELHLSNNNITIKGGLYLVAELCENKTLKVLDVYGAVSPTYKNTVVMSSTGWDMFFEFLGQSCSPLHTLNLGGNTIGDEQITSLVDTLNALGSVRDLNLRDTCITSSGWVKFFNLRRPGSVLETLEKLNMMTWFGRSELDDDGMVAFANALHGNTSFKVLDYRSHGVTEEVGLAALSRALCDKSSIESICNSNHTLKEGLYLDCHREQNIDALIKLNKGENKNEVIRQKVFRYYYSESNNLHEVTNMDEEILPYLLGAIAKDSTGIQLMYRVVKIMPSLFDTEKKTLSGKRKRKKSP